MFKHHSQVPHPEELLKDHTETFNDRLAKKLGDSLGSMWFFWFCVLLDLAALPSVVKAASVLDWVTYLAQAVIQLLALSILQIYQNRNQKISDAKNDADHQAQTHIALTVDKILALTSKTE